jgi:hypothetical protein
MVQMNYSTKNVSLDENLIRHIIINSIRSYVNQFSQSYGKNIVICCDNRKYWRKEVFPFYKSHRKKDRDASSIDWKAIFDIAGGIKEELKSFLPYKVLDVEGAEADDIIAVLTKRFSPTEKVLILSSDKDYVQLQKYGKNVQQYSPIMKRFIHTDSPNQYIKEHIIRGDKGDGIPNFLSPDETFVKGDRQRTINSKKLAEWTKFDNYEDFCTTDTMKRGFQRNRILVDFDYIPDKIVDEINRKFDETVPSSKMDFLGYLATKNMRNLISVADEF